MAAPRQARLEWSFRKGSEESLADAPREEADEKWTTSTPSPFKKRRSASSPQQWQDFTEGLEAERLRRIAEAQDSSFHYTGNRPPGLKFYLA